MKTYAATIVTLLAYLALVGVVCRLLHLHGTDLIILVSGLALIGLSAASLFVWIHHRDNKPDMEEEEGAGDGATTADIDQIMREANRRLKDSAVGRGMTLSNQTVFFMMGPSGSTKTTSIIHSQLDPELLAGQVYRDGNISPTPALNVWYSKSAIFIDPSGALLEDKNGWQRLVRLVQGARMRSLRSSRQAPRAAVVFCDVELLLRAGAAENAVAAARKLAFRLQDISRVLGIRFPVYAVFTKADRLVGFTEFVAGLSKEEASEILGVTLPVRSNSSGIYADEETARLSRAFDELVFSLANRRLDLLARENDMAKRPALYEFPRELGKVRSPLVQFLVELARPSQLSVHPFLRGFYFFGVRPIVVEDAGVGMAQAAPMAAELDAGATRMFRPGASSGVASLAAARVAQVRKVPQWVFLSRFFNEVLIRDRSALVLSSHSSRVSLWQRVVLAILTAVGLACTLGILLSFLRNHTLANAVSATIAGLPAGAVIPQQAPSLAELETLDRLRTELVALDYYHQTGPPLSLRWGLYVGDRIYPEARAAWYRAFNQLLFADTQGRLLVALRAVPDKPTANSVYDTTYNELKAYLITTSNHEKSSKEFLTPELMRLWTAGRQIDGDRAALARAQFDYYAGGLALENPYSSSNDGIAVKRARDYLANFAGIDRFYLPLLSKASAATPGVSFNDQFRDSVGLVSSRYQVRGPFTQAGFALMQTAIRNPSAMSVEDWVLGKAAASQLDQTTLQANLGQRYEQDFQREWHTVLQTSEVTGYRDYSDAASKLEKLSGLSSPLLELMWFVSHNTSTTDPNATSPFLPVQAIEPPGPPDKLPDAYIQPGNKDYIVALTKLQTDIAALSANPADPVLASQASNSASAALISVAQVMGTRVDQQYHNEALVRTLLEQPIVGAQALLKNGPRDKLNAAGKGLCTQFGQALGKYPFAPNATQDFPPDQLSALLAPKTGALWTFYDANLSQLLIQNGAGYTTNPEAGVQLTPAFLDFFNQAATLSHALFPNGSTTPKFAYDIKVLPSNVEGVTLKIGNDSLAGLGHEKTFYWTGVPENIQVTSNGGNILNSVDGPWAVFRFVSQAYVRSTGSILTLEWILQSNGRNIVLQNGQPESYHYQLEVSGPNPFIKGVFARMHCAPQVAH